MRLTLVSHLKAVTPVKALSCHVALGHPQVDTLMAFPGRPVQHLPDEQVTDPAAAPFRMHPHAVELHRRLMLGLPSADHPRPTLNHNLQLRGRPNPVAPASLGVVPLLR